MAAARTLDQWLAYQLQLHPRPIDLGLERVRAVADRLGLLPLRGTSALVGGTNGKGSTATMLAALARTHGAKVGVFTSPHLLRYQERIRVDDGEASDAALCQAFEQIEAARGEESLTFFEFNALAALWIFRAAGVDTSVLEVGLGGRLDATNLVDAGVAILCSVGIDHRDWLGDTLEAIGAEKAGIFRAGQPVVLGRGPMPASVEAKIADLGCAVKRAAVDFEWHVHADGLWDFRSDRATLERLPPPALAGVIQYQNAACALMAFDLLAQGARPIATRLDATATREALRNAVLPGRLQIVPGEVEWIFDVAHNEPAAVVLAAELGRRPVVGKTLAVFGMLGDKDISAVAAQLDPHIDHWLLASLDGPRALSAEALRQRMGPIRGSVQQCGSVEEATSSAARRALAGDRVLVCGSFQTVGPALRSRALY